MWIKYSLPRIRIDHMLNFNWKFLTPLALAVVMVTAVMDKLLGQPGTPIVRSSGMLAANIVIGLGHLVHLAQLMPAWNASGWPSRSRSPGPTWLKASKS